MHPAPPFALLSRNDLLLVLSAPNPLSGGGRKMTDGTQQTSGGWNRFAMEVTNITTFLNDPSGNPIELFEPSLPDL